MREEYEKLVDRTTGAMIGYYTGDAKRTGHFLKVHALARYIGRQEKLPEETQLILELAALTHDIGIKAALEKYGSSDGKYQEFEGPGLAGEMFSEMGGLRDDQIDRICWLISRHHTYVDIDDNLDYRILVEADALVNADEEEWSPKMTASFMERVFDTETGKMLMETVYRQDSDLEDSQLPE
ncbi:MAG: HD domain-containing protein [Eubacteriaceae bacterium]|jgi:uncharacterized protein